MRKQKSSNKANAGQKGGGRELVPEGWGVQLMAHRQRATAANDVDAPMTAATKWADRAAKERTKRTMSSRRRRWTAESTRAWLFYG